MQPNSASIGTYSIVDISIDTGRKIPAKDFHVFTNDEKIYKETTFNRPMRSTHFSIVLVLDGQFQVQLNLVNYTLTKNSLFVIPHDVVHQFKDGGDKAKIIVMLFSNDFVSQYAMNKKQVEVFDFLSSRGYPHLSLNDSEASTLHILMSLLKKKDLSEEEHPFKEQSILHAFNLFMFEIAEVYRKYNVNENMKVTRKEGILIEFTKLLSQHFKEERSVQFYADAMYMSAKHLTKSVKEITNKTCGELIDEMVIAEAKVLLNDLGMSVANVADELHFSDQFFFSKFFKKHAGVNPSEYKSRMTMA